MTPYIAEPFIQHSSHYCTFSQRVHKY